MESGKKMGYSAEIYQEAEKAMELRRLNSEEQLNIRRKNLFSRCPRAAEIENLIARTSIAAAKAVFGGANIKTELAKLKDSNLALQKELSDILKSYGLPENHLEQWYNCDKCRDTGYIDGKMCSCMKKLMREVAYENLNKMTPLALSDFDSFSLDYYSKEVTQNARCSPYTKMTDVLGFCKKYAKLFNETSNSLLFQGPPGLGKTHLSLAIAREVIDKGYGVVYVSAPAIITKIENEHFDIRNQDKTTESIVTECDLLIIDDLGTEFVTKFSISTVYNIINTRMIESKPTIISTNLTLTELQAYYNSRIISRIIGMLDRVEFVGTDIRQIKRRVRQS